MHFQKSILLSALLFSATRAFTPIASSRASSITGVVIRSSSSALSVSKEAQHAIDDAMRISKEKGYDSADAKVAWTIVEEINSRTQVLHPTETPHTITDNNVEKFLTYSRHINSLHHLLQSTQTTLSQVATLTNILKNEVQGSSLRITEELAMALAEARAADEIYGASSMEATAAWENVDAISDKDGVHPLSLSYFTADTHDRYKESALNAHHQYDAVVDKKTLDDAVRAISTLDHLRKQVEIEFHSLHGATDTTQLKP